MAHSVVEKYEQILAADPRSRIFVELAKALVERGEHARAIEVCRRGLEHHPSSILGRVIWGRALLESGDAQGATDQFEIAIGLEPASPYAYNQVGEALLAKGLHREALPVLARAAELQPADAKVRAWLEEAKQRAKDPSAPPTPEPEPEPEPEDERTEPYRPIAPAAPKVSSTEETRSIPIPAVADTPATPPSPQPSPPAAPPTLHRFTPPAMPAVPPPPMPPAVPPAPGAPRSVLHMIPGEMARDVMPTGPSLASRLNIPAAKAPSAPAPVAADPAEAERAAERYERELRERLLAEPEPPPSFFQRHRRLVLGGFVAAALAAAGGVYLVVAARNAATLAAGAAARGRAGLARDTLASLREAQRLLAEARKRSSDPEVGALLAEVSAILAVEHGDDPSRATARALVDSGAAGDGALAVAWLLADGKAARTSAEAPILSARPSQGALLQALAGRILASRGELEGARGRLDIAAHANPPLLRALSDLGDLTLAAGDAEGALAFYGAALGAHPTHPRSVLGAAEARLALGRDLEASRKDFDAVDADAGSAPPHDVKARFEIARARVVAALGDPAGAAARLSKLGEKDGDPARVAAAQAEALLLSRSWAQAEAAASRALSREPGNAELRVLLARARIGRGRYAEALSATSGAEGRAAHVQRAIASYHLGRLADARAELDRTAGRDGKVPGDAAVWIGLVYVASGKADLALPLLERLCEAKAPPPLAHWALGHALEAKGRTADAERAYRAAAEREPLEPAGPAALGRVLLAQGRAKDAIAPLERAVKLDSSDLRSRRALGEARLATGQPAAARADLDVVLLAAPKDADALRILSAAWLAEGQPREARLAAERAVAAAPKDPDVLVAAARAAYAAGDAVGGRKLASRALKAGAHGPAKDEAKRMAAGQPPPRR
jgi:tetratricopeptide (TPR) repeat protein